MSVKASVSLTEAQEAFAREQVAQGRFPSLSAVVRHGLELLRERTEGREAEIAALRLLPEERSKEPFMSAEASWARTRETIARRSAERGLQSRVGSPAGACAGGERRGFCTPGPPQDIWGKKESGRGRFESNAPLISAQVLCGVAGGTRHWFE